MNKQVMVSLKLTGVALAVSQAFSPFAYAQAAKADDTATVVVTGIRASARSSLAIKRDTMEIVDSITAEDIGKLPDPNVAETLTRIPGVQAYRYGGEAASPFGSGSGLTIRGLSNQTSSQVNDRAYFTAGQREFNVEAAVSGMVAGIDVYKNPSAEHVEGGIGGLVNIRTRNPSDFKGLTGSLGVNYRYNDLAKKTDPELFGLLANKWDLGGGTKLGVMGAVVYQKSTARSDSNGAPRGPNLKRAVRADSAEYATLAANNTTNSQNAPLMSLIGRSDVHALINAKTLRENATTGANMPDTTGLSAEQISNIMVAPVVNSTVFNEDIMRTRKGLNLAADLRLSNTLRFYAEASYTYYLYNQNYRFLFPGDSANVRNLQTTPFDFTDNLANRNMNGGSNDVVINKRVLGGSFLNSTMETRGGDEHTATKTWVGAAGVEWSPTPDLAMKLDLSYIDSFRSKDNRAVLMQSAPGKLWTVDRIADGAPHQTNFIGPDLSDPANFVFDRYNNDANEKNEDTGYAVAFKGNYDLGDGLFKKLKFGLRQAHQEGVYSNYNFCCKHLTTDGKALAADRSNAVYASSMPGNIERAPTDILRGDAGYAGGFVVYSPNKLLGNQVMQTFPLAGIQDAGALNENIFNRRNVSESTTGAYVQTDFSLLDERIRGNVGLRVVRTEGSAIARTGDKTLPGAPVTEVKRSTSYTNALPSLNLTYDITKNTLARFGYGRGITRSSFGDLNPFINTNQVDGSGNGGNPALRPMIADSFDLSLEHYFNKTNYVSAGVFDKEIDGFFTGQSQCETVDTAPAYVGTVQNGCTNGQYMVSRNVNAEKGYARGIEVAGQYFFDSSFGILSNFGVSGSYTYLDTAAPVIIFGKKVSVPQAFQSKNNFTVAGMYEDNKLSARLVYTWRSESMLFNVDQFPIWGRYMKAYGLLDGSINYEVAKNMTLSLSASNILDENAHRYVGVPGEYTGLELQHIANGRTFNIGLRYKFGN